MSQRDLKHRVAPASPAKGRKKPARPPVTAAAKPPKRRSRGASAKPNGQRRGLADLLRPLKVAMVMLGVVVMVGGGVYGVHNVVDSARERPVKHIGVEGEFRFIDRGVVADIVSPFVVDGFLQLSLARVKAALEAHPWIASAAISRRWPDTLHVTVTEEQPIARWGEAGFLNHQGEFIEVAQNRFLASLPKLHGEPGQERALMMDYHELTQLLRPHGLRVKEFYSDELMSRSLVLDNGLTITIGRDEVMEKVRRFLTVFNASLRERLASVASVDLRYGNGVAVRWKALSTPVAGEGNQHNQA